MTYIITNLNVGWCDYCNHWDDRKEIAVTTCILTGNEIIKNICSVCIVEILTEQKEGGE